MKTPVIYTHWGGGAPLRRAEQRPLFVPKGTPEGSSFDGKKKYFTKAHAVSLPGARYDLGSDLVRVIPEEYVAKLDEMDARVAGVHRERADLIAEAFRRGRAVKRADCETLEERRARRETEATS